jgi:Na+-translocating ferredoxin:NAD+ oxidoreductase RnfC subunit
MKNAKILNTIREMGVIGAGGAGFPTYKKLDASADHIIANGAECEPLLYKDREIMLREWELLFDGLLIMKEITGASKITIAVKKKNRDLAEKFNDSAKAKGIDWFVYDDVYPAGDEYVLVYEITGKRIPPGGLPLDVGSIVDNVETIINIAKAVHQNLPVTEKYVTVTGAVKNPRTFLVPVGISYAECIKMAGGAAVNDYAALSGGVMMGGLIEDFSLPLSKKVGGIIVLPRDHYLIRKNSMTKETYTRIAHGQCDQCSMCTEMCPRYILGYPVEPHKVMRNLLMTGEEKKRISLWAQYCVECNVCSHIACPEGLDPKNILADAKKLLRDNNLSRSDDELTSLFRNVHPARKDREVPISRVMQRLNLRDYDKKASFSDKQPSINEVLIPLDSHIGAPAKAIVKIGDIVKKGDVIARVNENELGSMVHASIGGRIVDINNNRIRIRKQGN